MNVLVSPRHYAIDLLNGGSPGRSCMRIAVVGSRIESTAHATLATYRIQGLSSMLRVVTITGILTSWTFGSSSSSPKMKTPGEVVASWINFAAAAPLADLDMSKKGSNLATAVCPNSMVTVPVSTIQGMRGCGGQGRTCGSAVNTWRAVCGY